MSGAGNCFLVADARVAGEDLSPERIPSIIADNRRNDGNAIEGVLLLRSCTKDHVIADFYNPDGSHGMMCGNGSRCIVRFAADHGLDASGDVRLTLNARDYTARIAGHNIAVDFPAPSHVQHYPIGTLEGIHLDVWYVEVGSDHVVIDGPCESSRPEVLKLRHHRAFPRGANVNMVVPNDTLHIATYERGVEAITGACGTGALSCAVVQWMNNHTSTSFTLTPPSGRPLRVELHLLDEHIVGMTLIGDATYDND